MRRIAVNVLFAALPVVVALLAISALLILIQQDTTAPLSVAEAFWNGAFRNARRTALVIVFWIPLVLVALGLVLTFRAGLWNIGVEGQMMFGGLFAAGLAFAVPDGHPLIMLPLFILVAMLGGALWAALVGVLKTRFGVNEIFTGVALNALANQITLQLIATAWRPADSDKAQYSRPIAEALRLPGVSTDFNVSLLALFIAFAAIIVVILLLARTRWGLTLKAVGRNPRSALLLGVPITFTTITALMACGALAGIGGAHRILFTYGDVRGQFAGGIGFLGLLVVLLVGMRATWVPVVAFVFAVILSGGTQLQFLGLDSSLTGVLQGVLVLCVLVFSGLRQRLRMETESQRQPERIEEARPVKTTPSS